MPNVRPLRSVLRCQWWWTGLGDPQIPVQCAQALEAGAGACLGRPVLKSPGNACRY